MADGAWPTLSSGGSSHIASQALMEEAREQKHRASVPLHRRLSAPSCRALRGLASGSRVQSSPQPMFDIGLSSVATALRRDLGGCLRGYLSLAFVAQRDRGKSTSATGRPRWGNSKADDRQVARELLPSAWPGAGVVAPISCWAPQLWRRCLRLRRSSSGADALSISPAILVARCDRRCKLLFQPRRVAAARSFRARACCCTMIGRRPPLADDYPERILNRTDD